MKAELREQLGKAGYQATKGTEPWEQQDEETKELYRQRGEAAVAEFVALVTPMAMQVRDVAVSVMSEDQRKSLEATLAEIMPALEE